MQPSSPKFEAGITLIELMFALAVVAIIAGFAGNAFSAAINASRTSSGLSNLVAALTSARTAAASTEVDVVMCPSPDGEHCAVTDHWEGGWIAFQATNGVNVRTTEPILQRQAPLPPRVHVVTTKGRMHVRFQPNGSNAGSNATFTFCDGRGARAATAYAMSNAGDLHAVTPDAANVSNACAGI